MGSTQEIRRIRQTKMAYSYRLSKAKWTWTTEQDAYPLPTIDNILSQLGNAKFFSALDLSSRFHQISMDSDSKKYTAFSTPQGHFHYNRMPFGLRNAPATFQRMMDTALRGLLNKYCFVYLDNIIIFGSTIQQHTEQLPIVLQWLKELGLNIRQMPISKTWIRIIRVLEDRS